MKDKLLELDRLGDVRLTSGGEYVPPLLAIKDNKDALKTLYFLYSPESPFGEQFERKKIAQLDQSKKLSKKVREIAKDPKFKAAAATYVEIGTPPLEQWLKATVKKMEELMDYWAKTKTTSKNYEKLAASLQGSQGLLELYNKYKKMIANDTTAMAKFRGGQEIRLFELPDQEPE